MTTHIVSQNTPENNNFFTAKQNFEKAYLAGKDYAKELQTLATIIAYSCINKCLDPQRKTAVERNQVSNNGNSPVLLAIKRAIWHDVHLLELTEQNMNKASYLELDENGEYKSIPGDTNSIAAVNKLIRDTLGDGMDVIQEVALAILEQIAEHGADEPGFLDKPYMKRKLDKRVVIKGNKSKKWKEVETTPIQEAFRAARAIIQSNSSVKIAQNGYTYIALDELDSVEADRLYYRLDKYADLGGYNCNGLYTANSDIVQSVEDTLDKLDLTGRQALIVKLRLRGYGYKAIASYLGVTKQTVQTQLKRIGEKLNELCPELTNSK